MKKITCEICGSNDVIKKDGFFECQTCGTKYSLEEVKKIVLEGNVDISGSTVKVDNSGNIENYLNIAKNAYIANNLSECEVYSNKILEIDSKHYEAWWLKGKLAICKSKIEEVATYFSKALDNTPEYKVNEIKSEIVEEINKILSTPLRKCVEFLTPPSSYYGNKDFINYPPDDEAKKIIGEIKFIKENLKELLLRCEVKELDYILLTNIYCIAICKWNDEITKEYYQLQQHPPLKEWQKFFKSGEAVVRLIEEAISLLEESTTISTTVYESLIAIYETLNFEDDKYFSEDEYLSKPLLFPEDECPSYLTIRKPYGGNEIILWFRDGRETKIMEWHKKWNEIDSTHVIPINE